MACLREQNAEPLPGYRLIEPLGSGGFGEAWKCEAPGGIFKAVKFVFGNLNSMDVDGARAEQEKKALDRIKEVRHPFVLQMDRIEEVNGELVIVMELADKSLHDAFEEAKASGLVGIPRDSLLRYTRDAAEALDHMNEKHGLAHLDIKARNLFMVSDRVKVADFGLVKHLERSGLSGPMGAVTPLYASPETFTGDVSPHSDQYSLAIVYQELLTGQRPFNGKNARTLAQQHMNEPPDLRALPESDRPIIARALEKDPTRRFPSCLAFVRALYTARAPTFASINLDAEAGPADRRSRAALDSEENFEIEMHGAGLTPGSRADDPLIPVELSRALNADNEAVSNLGMTVARPATGSLRPTVIVGIGGYGRRALTELRCRFIDRFGVLERLPMVRFLYVDSDADAIKLSQRGGEEVAFAPHQVYHLPLQPVAHYRRRQIDQLADWLPREKLYAVPRSLKTQGARALGRLAFTDNYLRLVARLKRELQHACHPDAIYQTVTQTGLALRDATPRVYVLGSGSGGASGLLADLGYAFRRLLRQAEHPAAPVVSFLFCGAPDDPATPRSEQANLYATLTELNHFADANIPFSAQYGTDGPRLSEDAPAFDQVYLLAQPHRTPEGRRDVVAHLASYLFHELTTPLGVRLDQTRRRRDGQGPFRSLGTFGVWFPRGLLLRVAAREACKLLLDEWQSGAGAELTPPEQSVLDAALARVLSDPDLRPEALAGRIDTLAAGPIDAPPLEALTRLLVQIEEQSNQPLAQDDPGAWSRQMLGRVIDWLGSGLSLPGINPVQQRRSPLTRALESAAAQLAQEWADRLLDVIKGLMEHSGRRIAVAEAAVAELIRFCDEAMQVNAAQQQRSARSGQYQEQLDSAVENCHNGSGGWSLFGGRSRRLLRVFIDHLAAFARQCVVEDTAAAVLQFFAALRGRLADRMRDLGYCRQCLRSLQHNLTAGEAAPDDVDSVVDTVTFSRTPVPNPLAPQAPSRLLSSTGEPSTALWATEAYWQTIRESQTARVVLPEGVKDLEVAARRFLRSLTAEHWTQLDQTLGDQVLAARGGLMHLCLDSGDVLRYFASPMLIHSLRLLSDHLPITDVAQVEVAAADTLAQRIVGYHNRAVPLVATPSPAAQPQPNAGVGSGVRQAVLIGSAAEDVAATDFRPNLAPRPPIATPRPQDTVSYLLVPASDAGKAFGEQAREQVPELQLVNVPGQADLTFCREQVGLRIEDLERLLAPCRNAYHESCLTPQSSPHARFDIHDWTPLDP